VYHAPRVIYVERHRHGKGHGHDRGFERGGWRH
jgi:hypothetical protein